MSGPEEKGRTAPCSHKYTETSAAQLTAVTFINHSKRERVTPVYTIPAASPGTPLNISSGPEAAAVRTVPSGCARRAEPEKLPEAALFPVESRFSRLLKPFCLHLWRVELNKFSGGRGGPYRFLKSAA